MLICVKQKRRSQGFTLIELIVTIVLLAVASTTIFGFFTNFSRTSVDPMIQQQALSIAEAYLEEILLKPVTDPDGVDSGESRSTYDDVDDYNAITSSAVQDQNGAAIADLSDYTVSVTVGSASLNGITGALLIQVSVDHPAVNPIVIHGFRTAYP